MTGLSVSIEAIAVRVFHRQQIHLLQLCGFSREQAVEAVKRGPYENTVARIEATEVALCALTVDDLQTLLERKRTFG